MKLSDFGDWLSPMIVKELRQGLRTRTFASVFIAWQAFLVLCLIVSTAASNSEGSNWFFWAVIMVLFVPILPLRGLAALSGEIKEGTLDLLQLTRLGAWRITFGKWAALVSQAGLIGISILPYIVMRYFAGGVSVVWEICALLAFMVMCGVLTAINVGLSALRSVILRGLLYLALMSVAVPAGGVVMGMIAEDNFADFVERYFAQGGFWATAGIVLGLAAYLIVYFLNLGVSQIATSAENHATLKRAVSALVLVGLAVSLRLSGPRFDDLLQVMIVVGLALTGIDCLSERPTTSPTVLHPFARRGIPGRLAGMVLAPGWHSGSLYFLGLTAVVALVGSDRLDVADFMKAVSGGGDLAGALLVGVAVLFCALGTVVLPAVLAVWMTRNREGDSLLGAVCFCLIGSVVASLIFAIVGTEVASMDGVLALFPALLPLSALIAAEDAAFRQATFLYVVPAAMTVAGLVLMWVMGRPYFRAIWRTAASENEPKTEGAEG